MGFALCHNQKCNQEPLSLSCRVRGSVIHTRRRWLAAHVATWVSGLLTLPCPGGARGAARVRSGAACPVGTRALRKGARRILGVRGGYGGRILFACKPSCLGARGAAAQRSTAFHPGHFPFRRGYGGPCPHPLKDLWPLRIPLATARHPHVATKAGRPLLMGRPALFTLCHNQKRNQEPLPPARGAGVRPLPGGSTGRRHSRPSRRGLGLGCLPRRSPALPGRGTWPAPFPAPAWANPGCGLRRLPASYP